MHLNRVSLGARPGAAFALVTICLANFAIAPALAAADNSHAMGDVPCSWNVPVEGANHELDVEATIRLLKANHFTCYVQPIEEHSPMAYQDFLNLLPAAQAGGIEVWAVLIPHTEGFSLPYREDFVGWMQDLAKLSL